MKRIGIVLASVATFCLATAGTALAQYPPDDKTGVGGTGGTKDGGVAFTGADISLGMVILAVLLVTGVAAILIGRRRAAAAVH